MRKLLAVFDVRHLRTASNCGAEHTSSLFRAETTGISSASSTVAFSVNVTVGDALLMPVMF